MADVIAGRFALCDPIARGGTGVVWRAYDRKLAKFCAAKVLRRRDAGDLLRFVREQSVRLSFPHVLTPYSWAAEDAHVVIASDLADGGSVSTLIGDYGPLAPVTVAALLDQLLAALEHVHDAGFVHRDVKPANLLLRATGTGPAHLMLADFGLAMRADDARLTEHGMVIGTPGYLPPEVLARAAAPEPRHDLFAAGRVAAALLAGREPDDLAPFGLEAAPGQLRDVVAALMSLDPDGRPPSAAAARSALRGLPGDACPRTLDGERVDVLHHLPVLPAEAVADATGMSGTVADTTPLPAESAPPGAAVARPRRRRNLLFAGLGAAVIAAVGIPLAVALTGPDSPAPHAPGRSSGPAGTPGQTASESSSGPQSGQASPTDPTGGPVDTSISVGDQCTFLEEGNRRTAKSGTSVVCVRRDDGSYVWTRR